MNFPKETSKRELLRLLDDIRQGVESGDTLEGFIQFGLPESTDADFEVLARYRVGNLQGQGGLRSFGHMDRPTRTQR